MHVDGVVAMANRWPSALRVISPDELIGRPLMTLSRLKEGEPSATACQGVQSRAVGGARARLFELRMVVALMSKLLPPAIQDGNQQSFQTVLRDVQRPAPAEAEIKRLVHHDGLTGLPNRALLLDRLETAIARSSRDGRHGALMLLDLDAFKDVNDTLGHPAGDRLLQIVARRLRGTLRSTDTLARLGGDEFAIVQTDLAASTGASGAATLAQKALDAIADPITIDDHDLFVTCSLGVTLFPPMPDSSGPVDQNADLALYRAKGEGGHRFQFFLEQMNAEVLQKKSLERELRRGIERGELSLVYQPQFGIQGGRPIGAEALVRWQPP